MKQNTTDKQHISDVLSWQDITSHKVTAIYSGVGSGKNHFIEQIVQGNIQGQPDNVKVLLLTSRRAKVNETLIELEDIFASYLSLNGNVFVKDKEVWLNFINSYFYELPDDLKKYEMNYAHDRILVKSAVMTYAKIESFLKKLYAVDPDIIWGYTSVFWDIFDLIVIDEVHSLVMDAGYQSAPFHVFSLIRAFYEKCDKPGKHMILMTGSPQPVDKLLHDTIPDVHVIDLFNKCINVVPNEIRFIEWYELKEDIEKKLLEGSRIIYFYNGKPQTSAEFCKDTAIDEDVVASTFSDQKARDNYKQTDDSGYARMVFTEDTLKKRQKLPEEIQLLLSTSRLKEGINVLSNVNYVYVDTHLAGDVLQMAGRVRNGGHVVYIIVDAFQFDDPADMYNLAVELKDDKEDVSVINKRFAQLDKEDEKIGFVKLITEVLEPEASIIKTVNNEVDSVFQYRSNIKFNYFTGIFEFYLLREVYYKYKVKSLDEWDKCNRDLPGSYKKLVSKWFPVAVSVQEFYSRVYQSKRLFNTYRFKIDSKERYSKEKIDSFIKDLQDIWRMNNVQINYYLKKFMIDVKCVRCGKNKKSYKFVSVKKESNE